VLNDAETVTLLGLIVSSLGFGFAFGCAVMRLFDTPDEG